MAETQETQHYCLGLLGNRADAEMGSKQNIS